MSFWNWLFGHTHSTFDEDAHATTASHDTGAVNPATGLPMTSGNSTGVDVGGSPFGFDAHNHGPTSASGGSFGGGDPWST